MAGPEEAPVRSFDDVIPGGYRVVVMERGPARIAMATSKFAMTHVFNETMEGRRSSFVRDGYEGKEVVLSEPKTLYFGSALHVKIDARVVALRITDKLKTYTAFGLQKVNRVAT